MNRKCILRISLVEMMLMPIVGAALLLSAALLFWPISRIVKRLNIFGLGDLFND